MKVWVLIEHDYDYSDIIKGIFSNKEKAVEAGKKVYGKWSIEEFELDRIEEFSL